MDLKRSNGPHDCQTAKGAVIFWALFWDPVQGFLGSILGYLLLFSIRAMGQIYFQFEE